MRDKLQFLHHYTAHLTDALLQISSGFGKVGVCLETETVLDFVIIPDSKLGLQRNNSLVMNEFV